MYIFPGTLEGVDSLWLIGDEFLSKTFTAHYKHLVPGKGPNNHDFQFAKENYELFEFSTTRFSSSYRNVFARLHGLLNKAINERKVFPKAIVFILDDDVIKQTKMHHSEVEAMEIGINYILEEVHREIASYKSKLPTKAKRNGEP